MHWAAKLRTCHILPRALPTTTQTGVTTFCLSTCSFFWHMWRSHHPPQVCFPRASVLSLQALPAASVKPSVGAALAPWVFIMLWGIWLGLSWVSPSTQGQRLTPAFPTHRPPLVLLWWWITHNNRLLGKSILVCTSLLTAFSCGCTHRMCHTWEVSAQAEGRAAGGGIRLTGPVSSDKLSFSSTKLKNALY